MKAYLLRVDPMDKSYFGMLGEEFDSNFEQRILPDFEVQYYSPEQTKRSEELKLLTKVSSGL